MAHTFTVSRVSILTGAYNTMQLPISEGEFISRWARYKYGEDMRTAFDNLNVEYREFLLNGVTPEETEAWLHQHDDDYCPRYSLEHGCTADECMCT